MYDLDAVKVDISISTGPGTSILNWRKRGRKRGRGSGGKGEREGDGEEKVEEKVEIRKLY